MEVKFTVKRKLIDEVKRISDEYKDDRRGLTKALRTLIAEGQKTGDAAAVGAAYYRMAVACYYQGDTYGVFVNSFKAVSLLKASKEYEPYAAALNILGLSYADQENNQLALPLYDEALMTVKRHRINKEHRTPILNNLANCYHEMGDCRSGIRILNDCIAQVNAKTPEGYTDLAIYSLNLAECYTDLGELQKAKEILDSMAAWIENADFKSLVCDYYIRSAVNSYRLGDRTHGNGQLDKAFPLIPENVYPRQIYDDLRQVSFLITENKDRNRAEKILALMIEYVKQEPDTVEQIIIYRTFADYYKAFGDCEQAAEYYAKLDELYNIRMKEQAGVQLKLHKRMKAANSEINKLQKKMKANESLLSREPLTGLLNRSALLTVSMDLIKSAAKKRQKVGAIFIDIDFFKECNDTYGHAKGDEIIRIVASACASEENANVRFARYGGDEFFGIARGLNDRDVTEIAKRICRRIQSADIPHSHNPNGHRVTLSVGVVNVSASNRTDTIIEIANYADKALYYAKNNGKNAIYLLDYDSGIKDNKSRAFIKIDF